MSLDSAWRGSEGNIGGGGIEASGSGIEGGSGKSTSPGGGGKSPGGGGNGREPGGGGKSFFFFLRNAMLSP